MLAKNMVQIQDMHPFAKTFLGHGVILHVNERLSIPIKNQVDRGKPFNRANARLVFLPIKRSELCESKVASDPSEYNRTTKRQDNPMTWLVLQKKNKDLPQIKQPEAIT